MKSNPRPLLGWSPSRHLIQRHNEHSICVISVGPPFRYIPTAAHTCNQGLIASLAYPLASKEHLRTGCDLMNFFFVFDEYTDLEDEHQVRVLSDIVMDALRNPGVPRPEGECIIGEIARQCVVLSIVYSSDTCAN